MDDTKKILLIEDDANLSQLLSGRLEKCGFILVTANDGRDGLAKVKSEMPDLIILDLKLPKLPGEEVCRQVRKDDATAKIPIIMMTGKTSEVDRVIGRVIGADYYITKPFEMSDLLSAILKVTEGK